MGAPSPYGDAHVRRALAHHGGLGHFMRSAGQLSLLTPQQEMDLGKRIQAGNEAALLLEQHDAQGLQLSGRQYERARMLRSDGVNARDELVRRNIRIAFQMARSYTSAVARDRYELEDKVQESMFGLIRAAEKFDPAFGYRFTTYATWWIRQSLQRGAVHVTTIRMPHGMVENLNKVWHARRKLDQAGGVLTVRNLARAAKLSEAEVQRAVDAEPLLIPGSMQDSLADGAERGDFMADPSPSPASLAASASISAGVRAHLAEKLNERERFILEKRFGIGSVTEETWSLDRIGEQYGLGRERIRQIEKKALEKLAGSTTLEAML